MRMRKSVQKRLVVQQANKVDVLVENHGTIFLFKPQTEAAKQWFAENVQTEGWQWLGKGLGVDHRFAENLVAGMIEAGLEVA